MTGGYILRSHKVEMVQLDASGTLLEDVEEATLPALNSTFDHLGLRRLSLEEFKEEFSLPCQHFLCKRGMSAYAAKYEFPKLFNSLYLDMLERIEVFPDVAECLAELRQMGVKTGVVSATPKELLLPTLKKLGLNDFDVILGDCPKPSRLPIYEACAIVGVHPSYRVIYAGDMEEDIICAKKAGVTSVAINRPEGGYHNKVKLESQKPQYLISDLRQLLHILEIPWSSGRTSFPLLGRN